MTSEHSKNFEKIMIPFNCLKDSFDAKFVKIGSETQCLGVKIVIIIHLELLYDVINDVRAFQKFWKNHATF